MTTEFKDALEAFQYYHAYDYAPNYDMGALMGEITISHWFTIRRALIVADRLMQEPSEGMEVQGAVERDFFATKYPSRQRAALTFKAMRDLLLKECE